MATTPYKRGNLGDVRREVADGKDCIVRDWRCARRGCAWLARRLARREAAALERLGHIEAVPRLIALEPHRLIRSFVPGEVMYRAEPRSPVYFRDGLRLLRRMHAAGVAHNDLAKEANWLCTGGNRAAVVDFQLAVCCRRRNRLFRAMAREDLRHWLKHKRFYCPDALTTRQRTMLARPSWAARCWRAGFKPIYRLLTRGLLRWPERTGAEERQRSVGR
jgi:RIO-like serine/threonine protein kinase